MKIIIKKNYREMSIAAAKIIAQTVREKPDCALGFATGKTPLGTYRELVKLYKEEKLDFSNIKTFNLDEYLGIGIDLDKPYIQDQSYARFMHEELFKHINLNNKNINMPDGLTDDPDKFCIYYEDKIKKSGGIELQLLGIGDNGHIAFNEPGSSLASRTRLVRLTEKTLENNYRSFFKKSECSRGLMPKYALTMGIGTLLESRHILLIADNKNKAHVIKEAIEGCVSSNVPASALQLHSGIVTLVLDEGAASELTWSLMLT